MQTLVTITRGDDSAIFEFDGNTFNELKRFCYLLGREIQHCARRPMTAAICQPWEFLPPEKRFMYFGAWADRC